ncbi:uncharacterized protein LOC134232209 [Saccostrea cucullata]|uniref:uncharacterized protein LOC134232209 n=1 Tax=Saccostrea cuccullata TaxID=36930 RepID=UPI002ED4FB52
MDSPGHTAQYCSYTFMEYDTKTILHIITMDKRVTEKKKAHIRESLLCSGLAISSGQGTSYCEVVTDAHVQVASVMKKDFPDIRHSFDIWHGTKNLGKKIIKAGQQKSQKAILSWTKDVVNHYLYTASISSTKEEFVGNWIGILHHTVNVHTWVLPYSDINECNHGPLTEERTKGWLEKDSPAHVALREIVLDKRLQNNVPYYLNCRSTAELENFQNVVNAYASKHHSYNPPLYRCRNRLVALDYNHHINRNVLVKKDGATQYQRSYNKKSGRWAVHPVKEKQNFPYIPSLQEKILLSRVTDEVGMNQPVVLEVDDPRRLSSHLTPVPPLSLNSLLSSRSEGFYNKKETIDMS